ncbi:MAG TPA: bifunctional riboflavin kinase/FAD synthetase [Firmicutes bacterium]|nr:bifunctional riboflavin kinase/FAD synthetase [Bacillota bacterium]
MRIVHDWSMLDPGKPRVVTLGNFDGVHVGHRVIITRAVTVARERGALALGVTFRNHTSEVVRNNWPPMLMNIEERIRIMAELGLDELLLLEFTRELSRMPAEEFCGRLLRLGVIGFVVGHDFRCGADRQGNTDFLRDFAARHGITAEIVPAVRLKGEVVSSTKIRNLLAEGKTEEANLYLGRPFSLEGRIGRGAGRGRHLGFPTANLEPELHRLVPRYGVYLVRATVEKEGTFYGLANVGVKPTFTEQPPLIETFLLDFSGDIYGRHMKVEFLAFLRPEERFASVDELIAQMKRDEEQGREIIAKIKGEE